MVLIYSLIAVVALGLIFGLVLMFLRNKKGAVDTLFAEARQQENSGRYEEALTGYENALAEINKVKFQKKLKEQIDTKIKLLRSLIDDRHYSKLPKLKS